MAFKPFSFKQGVYILKSASIKAKDLSELRAGIAEAGENSIIHHTCQYFLRVHSLEHTNDFAKWVGEDLRESRLAEKLSNIDPFIYKNAADLRGDLLKILDEYMGRFPQLREVLPGDEFCFNESVSLVFQLGIYARNLAEFLIAVKYLDADSIFFHFYEARIRLGDGVDDFSRWVEGSLGKKDLAASMRSIDIFMHNIEGTRRRLIGLVEDKVGSEMRRLLDRPRRG